jgi:hypothetical protein
MKGHGSKPKSFGMTALILLSPRPGTELLDRAVGCEDEEAVERRGEPAVVGDGEDRALVGLEAGLEGVGRSGTGGERRTSATL